MRETYLELEPFRQDASTHHFIYIKKKAQSKTYQAIFWAFSALFTTLFFIVYFKTTNWACSLYFPNSPMVKTSIYSLCLVLALVSFLSGHFLRPEKETIHQLVHKMETYLKELYKRQQQEINWLYALHADRHVRKAAFNQTYYQSLDKMRETKEITLRLLDKISYSTHNRETKDHLFNQAICELQEELTIIAHSFKQKGHLLTLKENTTPASIS